MGSTPEKKLLLIDTDPEILGKGLRINGRDEHQVGHFILELPVGETPDDQLFEVLFTVHFSLLRFP